MVLTAMLGCKETMAGFTAIIADLAARRSAQGSRTAVTTGAGAMHFGVDANRYADGSTVGSDMTGRAGLRHGDPA